MRIQRSSTPQHSGTYTKADTDSGPKAEVITSPSLHKYVYKGSLPACFDKVQTAALRGRLVPALPLWPVFPSADRCYQWALSQTSLKIQLICSVDWPSCQAALIIQLIRRFLELAQGKAEQQQYEASGGESWAEASPSSTVCCWWWPRMKMRPKVRISIGIPWPAAD